MQVTFPNFMIVGAAKSGTTSLYHYLNQHPEIYMSPIKEPLFFSSYGVEEKRLKKEIYPVSLKDLVRDFGVYTDLFSGVKNEKSVGEASVYYMLDHEKTIGNIKKLLPNWHKLKIIIILRNPIDASFSKHQMYSQYLKNVLGERNIPSFEESIREEDKRIKDGYIALTTLHWFYFYRQVKDYLDNFDNIKIYLYSDLKDDPTGLIRDLFDFLGVDTSFVPTNTGQKYNESGISKCNIFYRLLVRQGHIRKFFKPLLDLLLSPEQKEKIINNLWSKNLKKPVMNEKTRNMLKDIFHDDIINLQYLINRDLTHWFN